MERGGLAPLAISPDGVAAGLCRRRARRPHAALHAPARSVRGRPRSRARKGPARRSSRPTAGGSASTPTACCSASRSTAALRSRSAKRRPSGARRGAATTSSCSPRAPIAGRLVARARRRRRAGTADDRGCAEGENCSTPTRSVCRTATCSSASRPIAAGTCAAYRSTSSRCARSASRAAAGPAHSTCADRPPALCERRRPRGGAVRAGFRECAGVAGAAARASGGRSLGQRRVRGVRLGDARLHAARVDVAVATLVSGGSRRTARRCCPTRRAAVRASADVARRPPHGRRDRIGERLRHLDLRPRPRDADAARDRRRQSLPHLGHDGQRITFQSARSGGVSLYSRRVDGSGEPEPLIRPPERPERRASRALAGLLPGRMPVFTAANPHLPMSWSPDGLTLAFDERKPSAEHDIWVMTRGGEPSPFQMTPTTSRRRRSRRTASGWPTSPTSPVGARSACSRSRARAGSGSISPDGGTEPAWSADRAGSSISATAIPDDSSRCHARRGVRRGKPRPCSRRATRRSTARATTMSAPDGKSFVVVQERRAADNPDQFNVVLNWFAEVRVTEMRRQVPRSHRVGARKPDDRSPARQADARRAVSGRVPPRRSTPGSPATGARRARRISSRSSSRSTSARATALYELIVINHSGDVRVRGGRYFPDWTAARLAGCTAGGCFLKRLAISLGMQMEFELDCRRIITSPVRTIALLQRPLGTEPQ